MRLARSLLFTAYMMASACLFGAFMALCFWLPYRLQFAIARSWARCLFWVLERLCGLRYVVEGREHIPAGNHIVMSNHTSAWETIAQFVIFPPQVWVLKRELLWIPFVGWGLKLLRSDRDRPGRGPPRGQPGGRAGQGAARGRPVGHHFSRRARAWSAGETKQVRRERRAARHRVRQADGAAVAQRRRLLAAPRHHQEAGHDPGGHRRADLPGQGKKRATAQRGGRAAIEAGLAKIAG